MNLLAFIEIPTFTGLPAHPFFNRIAMYLVPTAIGVVLLALRPRWRDRLTPWAFGLSVAALLSVQLTMGAGEVMDNVVHGDANPLVEDHESWSKLLRIGLIVQVLATGALFRSVRRAARRDAAVERDRPTLDSSELEVAPATSGRSVLVSGAVTAVVALAVTGLTVMTAHSGSKSVYQEDGEIMTGETGTDVAPQEDTSPDGTSESTGG